MTSVVWIAICASCAPTSGTPRATVARICEDQELSVAAWNVMAWLELDMGTSADEKRRFQELASGGSFAYKEAFVRRQHFAAIQQNFWPSLQEI
jgi:hypothetical protein